MSDDVDTDYSTVNLGAASANLELLQRRLVDLDGTAIPPKASGRARSAELAELTKELLFLTHLCDRVKTAIMDEYYVSRGVTEHLE